MWGTMRVAIEDVDKIGRLARLSFSVAEKAALAHDLDRILDYVNMLDELDLTEVPPTFHVLDAINVFRADTVEPSLPREEVLRNAPRSKQGYFSVPKVIY